MKVRHKFRTELTAEVDVDKFGQWIERGTPPGTTIELDQDFWERVAEEKKSSSFLGWFIQPKFVVKVRHRSFKKAGERGALPTVEWQEQQRQVVEPGTEIILTDDMGEMVRITVEKENS